MIVPCPSRSPNHSSPMGSKGVKLPKLDVPAFDDNILNWRTFWEQFCSHDRTSLSNSEKLVYLQHALKNGTAKASIEGLSRSGECYKQAVECLKSCHNHPRLIHQTHVKMILDAGRNRKGIEAFSRHCSAALTSTQGHGLRAFWTFHHVHN